MVINSNDYVGFSPFYKRTGCSLSDKEGAREGISFQKFQNMMVNHEIDEVKKDIIIFLYELGDLTKVLINKAFYHPNIEENLRRFSKLDARGKPSDAYKADIDFLKNHGIISYRSLLSPADSNGKRNEITRIYTLNKGPREWAFRTKDSRVNFYKPPKIDDDFIIDNYTEMINHEAAMMFHIKAVVGAYDYFESFAPICEYNNITFSAIYELFDGRKLYLYPFRDAKDESTDCRNIYNVWREIEGEKNLIFLGPDYSSCEKLHLYLSGFENYDQNTTFYATDLSLRDMPGVPEDEEEKDTSEFPEVLCYHDKGRADVSRRVQLIKK